MPTPADLQAETQVCLKPSQTSTGVTALGVLQVCPRRSTRGCHPPPRLYGHGRHAGRYLVDRLNHLLRLHDRGGLQLERVRGRHVLGAEPDDLQRR